MKYDPKRKVRVLLSGGPTRAYLDDVRFLSNYSSGRLAYEIIRALGRGNAEVAAVLGPTCLDFSKVKLRKLRNVETMEEMRKEMLSCCRTFRPDVVVFAAAVLDFQPVKRKGKVSSRGSWTLKLHPTPKIVDEVARRFPRIERIGFKLEWERKSLAQARRLGEKLMKQKKYKGLCLNYLSDIRSEKHSALLFSSEKMKSVDTKRAIAHWVSLICHGCRRGSPQ